MVKNQYQRHHEKLLEQGYTYESSFIKICYSSWHIIFQIFSSWWMFSNWSVFSSNFGNVCYTLLVTGMSRGCDAPLQGDFGSYQGLWCCIYFFVQIWLWQQRAPYFLWALAPIYQHHFYFHWRNVHINLGLTSSWRSSIQRYFYEKVISQRKNWRRLILKENSFFPKIIYIYFHPSIDSEMWSPWGVHPWLGEVLV